MLRNTAQRANTLQLINHLNAELFKKNKFMPTASQDNSEPAIPMATPMSAFLRAGESLTPTSATDPLIGSIPKVRQGQVLDRAGVTAIDEGSESFSDYDLYSSYRLVILYYFLD